VIDSGNPSGCTYDDDVSAGTPPVPLEVDQRGSTRHADGDGSGTARCDIGAVELLATLIFSDGFESGDTSAWDATAD
jgi:hypothetical protein